MLEIKGFTTEKIRLLHLGVLTNTLKYMSAVILADYLRSNIKCERITSFIDQETKRPLVSTWHEFIKISIEEMKKLGHHLFIPELPIFYERVETKIPKKDKITLPRGYCDNDGNHIENKEKVGWIEALISERNAFAHGRFRPSLKNYKFCYRILKKLLVEMKWCADYKMYKLEGETLKSLRGSYLNMSELSIDPRDLPGSVIGELLGIGFLVGLCAIFNCLYDDYAVTTWNYAKFMLLGYLPARCITLLEGELELS